MRFRIKAGKTSAFLLENSDLTLSLPIGKAPHLSLMTNIFLRLSHPTIEDAADY
jgi:hypothetical protein